MEPCCYRPGFQEWPGAQRYKCVAQEPSLRGPGNVASTSPDLSQHLAGEQGCGCKGSGCCLGSLEESSSAKGEIQSKVSQGGACRRGARSNRHVSLVRDEVVRARTAEKHTVCSVEVFGTDLTQSQVLSMHSWFLN